MKTSRYVRHKCACAGCNATTNIQDTDGSWRCFNHLSFLESARQNATAYALKQKQERAEEEERETDKALFLEEINKVLPEEKASPPPPPVDNDEAYMHLKAFLNQDSINMDRAFKKVLRDIMSS